MLINFDTMPTWLCEWLGYAIPRSSDYDNWHHLRALLLNAEEYYRRIDCGEIFLQLTSEQPLPTWNVSDGLYADIRDELWTSLCSDSRYAKDLSEVECIPGNLSPYVPARLERIPALPISEIAEERYQRMHRRLEEGLRDLGLI